MRAMMAQCKAEIIRTLRNRRFLFASVIMPAAFYFIFTGIYGDNIQVGNVNWKSYYLMSMTIFGVVGGSLSTVSIRFAQERSQGWVRLLRITPLPDGAYIFSKIASQSMLNLGTIVLMFLIGALGKGVALPFTVWVYCGLWIWLGAIPFLALGTLLGTIRSVELVQVVSQVLFMGMSLLGGLWMPVEAMPKGMRELAQWLPSYRFGQGAWSLVE
ncbi:ABC transporter permease [Paenibacillus filicis]|uniref:ABC transporter permease n=1 Tax=Paenibacillus gyeongsangnamensis TaxID=3388067 RepID=A0ABT4QBG8_9BACL|nr:ABC transporter permease [Paenibacillus filicis]MCZ8514030.1 ABC transporter permease [Paenibacillus filicis]